MLRRQPPVHSPLGPRALLSGAAAVATGDGSLERLRAKLLRRYSARKVLLTDSGTTALALALAGAARSRGGPTALPAFGCYDLATAADAADVEVVLYDVDPARLAPDPNSLEAAMRRDPSSVVVAPLYGVPFEMGAVRDAAESVDALVVEDAAQGVGAAWRDRPLGSIGELAVLSFGRGKGMTGGGGGALLANSREREGVVDSSGTRVADAGAGWGPLFRAAAQWALGRPSLYWLPTSLPFLALGDTVYREPEPAAGMPTACAAVLLATMEACDEESARRRRHADRLLEAIDGVPDVSPVEAPPEGTPGWLRLPVLARGEAARDRLSTREARRRGVMPGYPKPLSRLPGFERRCLNAGEELPGAETLAASLFTLPTHGLLEERDLDDLTHLLRPRRESANGGPRA